ncbi:MAG: hypothetical protein Q4F05_12895 [bacterium]|nr:hypothetical protein [bacterium]
MIKAEFGIIDSLELDREYIEYEPEKYDCVAIDDDQYMDNWWSELEEIDTYEHSLKRPAKGGARWGITIIPPESLEKFYRIVINDKRIAKDVNLKELANKINDAINQNKYMIHFGI